MNYLSFFFVFLIIVGCFAQAKDLQEVTWFSLYHKEEVSRDFMREYLSGVRLEEFPSYLLHYVHYRMELMESFLACKEKQKSPEVPHFHNTSQGIYRSLRIPVEAFISALPIDFDFKIKYKKIKETQGKRPPLMMNYLARELEITEGFEAGETLFGSYRITPSIKLVSHIALFEKWVTERQQYEEAHHLEMMSEQMQEEMEKFTGTFKYALGWVWNVQMKHERNMSIEFLMQQKTHNQWNVQESKLKESHGSGVMLDHWVITITLDF